MGESRIGGAVLCLAMLAWAGAAQGHGGQAQILSHEGVLYAVNGANDAFAMDVETGVIRWRYEGKPDPRAGSPVGRTSCGGRPDADREA